MKALTVGAGPAGLATAFRLKQALGIEAFIYGIKSEPTTLGGVVQLPPNGLHLIERLGLSKAILARGFSSGRVQLHSMQGEVLADWHRMDSICKATEHGYMHILRNDLHQVLLDAVREH